MKNGGHKLFILVDIGAMNCKTRMMDERQTMGKGGRRYDLDAPTVEVCDSCTSQIRGLRSSRVRWRCGLPGPRD